MKGYTRRPERFRPALYGLVVALALALADLNAAAQTPPPSAIDIFKANVAADTPLPNPFQLRARLEVDGKQVADLTLGWSGGALLSLQAKLPIMPGLSEVTAALRPSGLAFIKVGSSAQVLAPLVPYSRILELLPRLVNRALLTDMVDSLASSVRLIGETEIKGRRAYIIEWTLTPQAILATMKMTLTRLASDDEVASLLDYMGFPLDKVLANWDEDISAESALPPSTYRQYVDALDYVTLDYDLDTSTEPSREELLAALTPNVELEEIAVGDDSHIERLVWRVTLDVTRQELASLYAALADAGVAANGGAEAEAEAKAEAKTEAEAEAGAGAGAGAEAGAKAQAEAELQADAKAKTENQTVRNEEPAAATQSPSVALEFRISLQRIGQGYLPAEISGRIRADRDVLSLLKVLGPLEEKTRELPVPLGVEDSLANPPGPSAETSPEPVEHTFRLTLQWDTTRGAEPALVENSQLLDAERSWKQAQAALEADDWEAAIPPLARLTRQVPTFVSAHLYLSDAYINTGDIWPAIGELEQVVMLQPENWLALNNLAYLYVDNDIDVARGLELALAAHDLLPDPAPAFVTDTLGWAYYKSGDLEAASRYLEDALVRLDDENQAGMYEPEEYAESAGTLHYHLGAVYAARGMYDRAKAHLEMSLQHDPDLAQAQELLTEVNEALAKAGADS